ncbi:MAG TPA: ABC transporter ATP-binding protein [Steroidobacteraceae bacterium]|nr:ABC transporter ATP-binding protein [Steroidobacteraceae bacterium]HQR48436.1 ABC transporter ATP-binding protein [Steroidobacteraceae bacterium]
MSTPLLEVRGLRVEYPARGWGGRRGSVVPALHGLDLALDDGRSLGIVGESGCGKSTLVRSALGLVAPSDGEVRWRGWTVDTRDRARMRQMRREMQVVFQDPFGSLDPRLTAGESVAEALQALEGVTDAAPTRQRVSAAFAAVGLDASLASRYPHELSGGQCQRVAIARATIVRPRLLICDEPVSALDVSVQAQIVNLLAELRRRDRTALLFISHNLAVVRHLCEEVAVLYLGRIVERAPRDSLFLAPRHPYTRALLAAVPDPDPGEAARRSRAESPTVVADRLPAAGGCPFSPRCPLAVDRCRIEPPELESTGDGAVAACHRWRELPTAQLD